MSDARTGPGWDAQIELTDGARMPLLGIGTQYGFTDDGNGRGRHERAPDYVALAIDAGFRFVDTARCYATEAGVQRGIEQSGVGRASVFVASKAWPGVDHPVGRASSLDTIRESAANLGGYIDLFLVHHPAEGWRELWGALEDAHEQGLVRSIGVSNFRPEHIDELLAFARVRPVANEIHLHPFVYDDQLATIRHCREHGLAVIAYPRAPWAEGPGGALDAIAERHGRTRAQVLLRWAIEHEFAVIPLSTNEAHLAENFAVREFELAPGEVRTIDGIGDAARLRFHVDVFDTDRVAGWAFAGELARVQVSIDGEPASDAERGLPRADVAEAFPGSPGAGESGFAFHFGPGVFEHRPREVTVEFCDARGAPLAVDKRSLGGGSAASS